MIFQILLITIFLFMIKGANAQNPDGDQLICYESMQRFYTIGCLGATSQDFINADNQSYAAGDIYRTYCTKGPDETWFVNNEAGRQTLRLKSDPTKCLTIPDGPDTPVRLAPCDPNDPSQTITFDPQVNAKPNLPDYKYFWISSPYYTLIHDVKHSTITKTTDPIKEATEVNGVRHYCLKWVWVSQVEQMAKPFRSTAFTFPIDSTANPALRKPYIHAFPEQMMHSSLPYPEVTITRESCNQCKHSGPCNCFPIDYDMDASSNVDVTLDLGIKVGGPSESFPSRNRIATGLYAKPWTTMSIKVPKFDPTKITIIATLFLHDDFLIKRENNNIWYRPPVVKVAEFLKHGLNRIRSPYGGPLTIDVIGRDTTVKPITITIYNGEPMAKFVLGETTEITWANELQKKPGWMTIQGEHVVGLQYKCPYQNASFSQVAAVAKRFDLMLKNHLLLSGYDFNPTNLEDLQAAPQGTWWWATDAPGDDPHSGNPVALFGGDDDDMTLSVADTWNVWLFAHEFGHDMQTKCYSDLYGGEVTNNMYSAFASAYFCGDGKYAHGCKAAIKYFDQWANGAIAGIIAGKTYKEMMNGDVTWQSLNDSLTDPGGIIEADDGYCIAFWLQIITIFGFEPIRNMHRRFREMVVDPKDKVCNGKDDSLKFDAVYEILSEMTNTDLTKHWDTYKIPLSDAVRQRVATKKYPQPPVDISKVKLPVGTPLNWKPSDPQPSYALPPFKNFPEAQ